MPHRIPRLGSSVPGKPAARFTTVVRGAYLDSEGQEQYMVFQSTQSPDSLLGRGKPGPTLREAAEAVIGARGGVVLSLQLVLERAQPIDLGVTLGKIEEHDGYGKGVVPLGTATRQF